MTDKPFGQIAFEAYKDYMLGNTYDNKPIPNWNNLGLKIQDAWNIAAITAITEYEKNSQLLSCINHD